MIFVKERIPLVSYVILVGGLSASGIVLGSTEFDALAFSFSAIGLLLFFVVLRLMDEYKDYEKDLVAHPQRPLPRGLLAKDQVLRAIHCSMAIMTGYACVNYAVLGFYAGLFYLFIAAYLWLMFKEFFVGAWLSSRPFLYAFSHQLILVLCCIYAFAVTVPASIWTPASWYFSMVVLGAFFAYEICRKLDPDAHPILGTYLHYYGQAKTSALVLLTTVVAAIGSDGLGLQPYLAIVQSALILTLTLLFKAPGRYKIIEAVASISLIVHLWALPLSPGVWRPGESGSQGAWKSGESGGLGAWRSGNSGVWGVGSLKVWSSKPLFWTPALTPKLPDS